MKLGVVIPVGPGRSENLALCLHHLADQNHLVDHVVVVLDGPNATRPLNAYDDLHIATLDKQHEPGMEQPRNVGVRKLMEIDPSITHVAFLDSDVLVAPTWREDIGFAYSCHANLSRVMVCPYDWMPQGSRRIMTTCRNDPRWAMFAISSPDIIYSGDLSAGLACFSGNLVWPIDEFMRVGGFWSEIHHGRCEDGELGLRAVAMGVPISFGRIARGWHLWHPVNHALVLERNARDVPMLNKRHPWVEGAGVFMVDRDGAGFDVLCSGCGKMIPTNGWWFHVTVCSVSVNIPVEV